MSILTISLNTALNAETRRRQIDLMCRSLNIALTDHEIILTLQ